MTTKPLLTVEEAVQELREIHERRFAPSFPFEKGALGLIADLITRLAEENERFRAERALDDVGLRGASPQGRD